MYLRVSCTFCFSDASDCGYPEQSHGSTVHLDVAAAGAALARYSCNPGYTVTADQDTRHCRADGFWSGQPPECARKMLNVLLCVYIILSAQLFLEKTVLVFRFIFTVTCHSAATLLL